MTRELTHYKPSAGPPGIFNPADFQHMHAIATLLVESALMPAHLTRDSKTNKPFDQQTQLANVTLVVNAARQWRIDPFALARGTYVVGGKLDFDGKIYAGLVHSQTNLVGRLKPTYQGSGASQTCTLAGRFSDEADERTITTPTVDECKHRLDKEGRRVVRDAWKNGDDEQQLFYTAVRIWVRRHCPELLLGYTTAEAEVGEDEHGAVVVEAEGPGSERMEEHYQAIADAVDMNQLRACAGQIESDRLLSREQREALNAAGRARREELEAAAELDQRGQAADAYAERIENAENLHQLGPLRAAIESDERLDDDDRGPLLELYARKYERLAATAQV